MGCMSCFSFLMLPFAVMVCCLHLCNILLHKSSSSLQASAWHMTDMKDKLQLVTTFMCNNFCEQRVRAGLSLMHLGNVCNHTINSSHCLFIHEKQLCISQGTTSRKWCSIVPRQAVGPCWLRFPAGASTVCPAVLNAPALKKVLLVTPDAEFQWKE